jgi:hypothetical protein
MLEVLSKVVRGIESTLLARVDKQDQRLQELADKQEQQAKTTGDRFDKMVLFTLTTQLNNLLDKYDNARAEHMSISGTLHLAHTLDDKAAITATLARIHARATRLRDEALVLAQEAGIDIKSRLEDF